MPQIVTMGKTPNRRTTWVSVEPVKSRRAARRVVLEYLRGFVYPGSGWSFVCCLPKQGPVWRVRRIVHDSGKTIECVILDDKPPREYDDRLWPELSE